MPSGNCQLIEGSSKALPRWNCAKRWMETRKSSMWNRYFLFLLIIYSISLLPYDDALPMMVESFHVDLQPIHYIYASSVSILSLFVCMFTYHLTFSFFSFSFYRPSWYFFLAAWHVPFVATYWTICTHHLSTVGISGRTNLPTFLCHCTFVYYDMHDEIWLLCLCFILRPGNNDATMSTKSNQVLFTAWWSYELLLFT